MDNYPICNHKKDTAPVVFGKTFVLCWRCTGVMLALILMGIIRWFSNISFGVPQLIVGFIIMVPMLVDGTKQYYFGIQSTNKKRCITGMLFGLGVSLLVFIVY